MKCFIYTVLILVFAGCKKESNCCSMGDYKLSIDSLEELVSNIPKNHYFDLSFTSPNTGYALSAKFIAKTTNGGLSWDSFPLPLEHSWRKIQFTDASNGYIIGGDNTVGYLLKTLDGGQTWELIDLGVQESPSGIHFIDHNTGFITGNSFFRKTSDGGRTWTNVGHQGKIYYDVKFRNALFGYATAFNGAYFKTTDGGNTWDSLKFRQPGSFIQVHYTDNQTLMEIANDSVVDLDNNLAPMKVPHNAEKLLFTDADHSIGIGSHYEGQGYFPYGDIFVTNNGWKTFNQKTYTTSFAIRFTAIARMSVNKVMILGFGFEGTRVLILEW